VERGERKGRGSGQTSRKPKAAPSLPKPKHRAIEKLLVGSDPTPSRPSVPPPGPLNPPFHGTSRKGVVPPTPSASKAWCQKQDESRGGGLRVRPPRPAHRPVSRRCRAFFSAAPKGPWNRPGLAVPHDLGGGDNNPAPTPIPKHLCLAAVHNHPLVKAGPCSPTAVFECVWAPVPQKQHPRERSQKTAFQTGAKCPERIDLPGRGPGRHPRFRPNPGPVLGGGGSAKPPASVAWPRWGVCPQAFSNPASRHGPPVSRRALKNAGPRHWPR